MDIIIREAENTDNLDGILFTHSVSGGTGSGTGSLLLESLLEAFPKKVIQTYRVFANSDATGTTDVVVHPYNWILSMQRLIENPGGNCIVKTEISINLFFRSRSCS